MLAFGLRETRAPQHNRKMTIFHMCAAQVHTHTPGTREYWAAHNAQATNMCRNYMKIPCLLERFQDENRR